MKKQSLLCALLSLTALLSQNVNAQSWASFYHETQSQRTVVALPSVISGVAYIGSETIFNPSGDNSIHLVCYDVNAKPITPWPLPGGRDSLSEANFDERNVDIISINSTQIVQVSYYASLAAGNPIMIRLVKIDITTGATTSRLLRSTDATYNSLVAMDAVYDAATGRIVLCGTAVNSLNVSRNGTKQAFVATVTAATLAPVRLEFYNSPTGPQTDDDIATRVVLNGTGRYYVTGSENVPKPSGSTTMGMRNMLIDPNTLVPIWSVPITLNDNLAINGVDMVQAPASVGGEFVTLVNFQSAATWGIIRVNPGTGVPAPGQIEQSAEKNEMGHSIILGNSVPQLVIKGMKNRSLTPCQTYDTQADPFEATVDVSGFPALLIRKNEYLTTVGTMAGATDYWTIGGIYSPRASGYPLAVFANNFADRTGASANYCLLSPILDLTKTLLNTKSIAVDLNTNTACSTSQCLLSIQNTFTALTPTVSETSTAIGPNVLAPTPIFSVLNPYGILTCAGGYYKPTDVEEVASENAAVSILPNPASNTFSVQLSDSYKDKNTQVVLCDISGKVIGKIYEGVFDGRKIIYNIPSSIPTGMYFVQTLSVGLSKQTDKIIINK